MGRQLDRCSWRGVETVSEGEHLFRMKEAKRRKGAGSSSKGTPTHPIIASLSETAG
jgi:hypothetical protein